MNNSPRNSIYVHGYGCVSSAGLSAEDLYQKCANNTELQTQQIERSIGQRTLSYPVRAVDKAALKKVVPKHPRLRRSSPVTKFAVAAAKQALGEHRAAQIKAGEFRLGIVVSFFNGCINYSNKFYTEVLDDPAFASPILFPETVFNAPASHVASFFESDGPVYTLVGDSSVWMSALEVASDWLASDLVDGCLVLSGEELDWLSSEALQFYSKDLIATEGASAVYLERETSDIQLDHLSQPHVYTSSSERRQAISELFKDLPTDTDDCLLVDGLVNVPAVDRDESKLLSHWDGSSMSPLTTLGMGMGSSCGLQTIVALEALKHSYTSSVVLASGSNQQAYSARFKLT